MKIIDTLVIAQDKSMLILKVNEKYFLLSISNSDIKLIKEFDDFKENDLSNENSLHSFKNNDFNRILKDFVNNKK